MVTLRSKAKVLPGQETLHCPEKRVPQPATNASGRPGEPANVLGEGTKVPRGAVGRQIPATFALGKLGIGVASFITATSWLVLPLGVSNCGCAMTLAILALFAVKRFWLP